MVYALLDEFPVGSSTGQSHSAFPGHFGEYGGLIFSCPVFFFSCPSRKSVKEWHGGAQLPVEPAAFDSTRSSFFIFFFFWSLSFLPFFKSQLFFWRLPKSMVWWCSQAGGTMQWGGFNVCGASALGTSGKPGRRRGDVRETLLWRSPGASTQPLEFVCVPPCRGVKCN